MTNREAILLKMSSMSNEDLANYLDGDIGDDISMLICHQCQCDHNGNCLMDMLRLEHCPKQISDWLQEQAV